MRQVAALAWKEWREVRWVVGFALVMFVGIPLIAGIEGRRYTHGLKFESAPWVMFFGWLLATVVAATSVCRDLDSRLADFWQSRAVRPGRWMWVKFVVGLAVLLICCLIPMAIEEWLNPGDYVHSVHFAAVLCAWLPFILAVQYGFGFLSGALTRRAGPAILLALALSLLAYTLPIILPPLRPLNLTDLLIYSSSTHPPATTTVPWVPWWVPFAPRQQLPFLITAIAVTFLAFAIGVIAVRRDWEIRAARKLTYWSIAAAILLVFATATFQLATNLPVLHSAELGTQNELAAIRTDGKRGVAFYFAGMRSSGNYECAAVRPIEIAANSFELGPELRMKQWAAGFDFEVWLPDHPEYVFVLRRAVDPTVPNSERVEVGVFNLRNSAKPLVNTIDLGSSNPTRGIPRIYTVGDRPYIVWWSDSQTAKAALLDVQDPEHPKVTPAKPYFQEVLSSYELSPTVQFDLVPINDVPLQQRLEASVAISGRGRAALSGDLLATSGPNGVLVFRLSGMKEPKNSSAGAIAEFHLIGQYKPSMLESWLGIWGANLSVRDGLLYSTEEDTAFGRSLFRVTVFDLSDPARPRPIGHFAAPSDGAWPLLTSPLSNGRLLAGSKKLYLLGPPPGW